MESLFDVEPPRVHDAGLARMDQARHAAKVVDTPPFVRSSATSREAARVVKPRRGNLQMRVLDLLRASPHTDESGALELEMSGNTYRPRRIELVTLGLVEAVTDDNGEPVTVKGRSGRAMQVWRGK